MFKRKSRSMPELNTTSTADISFMLLTFFLVTTSMDSDHGLPSHLPPQPQQQEAQTEAEVAKSDMLNVRLDGNDRLTLNGKPSTLTGLRQRVEQMAQRRPTQHIVAVAVEPTTTYDAFFHVQNTITAAYNAVRDRYARKTYHRAYAECNADQREAINKRIPQRIMSEE